MRLAGLYALAVVAACYRQPSPDGPCQITCTDESGCPDGTTCQGGYCLREGQVCRPTFTQVTAGTGFACALDSTGALWCWGSNAHHVIDPGNRFAYAAATRVASTLAWESIDAGGDQMCGIAGGQLYCWGGNTYGEASQTPGDISTPTAVTFANAPATWTAVSAGAGYTCAIGDGTLYCWGHDGNGQLGNPDQVDHALPIAVTSDTTWTAVSAGSLHTCGLRNGGELVCWGASSNGECGPSPTGNPSRPVSAATGVQAVAVADVATCYTTAGGALACMGNNTFGVVATTSVTGFTQLAAGRDYACGLAGSDVHCWGTARAGGLGHGLYDDGPAVQTPAFFNVVSGASAISVGWNAGDLDLSCALVGGDVQCWGDDRFGQLGTGAASMTAPVEVAGMHAFSQLSVGPAHTCGVEHGALYCWGSTAYGAPTSVVYGNSAKKKPCVAGPTEADRLCDVATPKPIMLVPGSEAVTTGAYHTCSLHAGIATCWGDNGQSQLGTSTPAAPAARMVPGPGGAAWTSLIQTGRVGQCALAQGQTSTYCWGTIGTTQASPAADARFTGVTAFALGGATNAFSCHLDAAHMLVCEGDNARSQWGDGTTTGGGPKDLGRAYSAIATQAFGDTVCGVRMDQKVECWGANTRGQTADGNPADGTPIDPTPAPFTVPGLAGCTAVAVGLVHACALCGDAVSCWGDNRLDQLGGDAPSDTPVLVPRLVNIAHASGDPWVDLQAGAYHTCARTQSGAVTCWGFADRGALGNGGVSANLPTTVIAQPIP